MICFANNVDKIAKIFAQTADVGRDRAEVIADVQMEIVDDKTEQMEH